MTAKELRIGNIIESRTKHPVKANWGTLRALENGEKTYFPIPLTEEWLEKFGFKITGQTPHPNNIWTVYGEECKFELEHIISFFLYDNKCFGTEVKYVHQLQNLYFALTGEELTFKQD